MHCQQNISGAPYTVRMSIFNYDTIIHILCGKSLYLNHWLMKLFVLQGLHVEQFFKQFQLFFLILVIDFLVALNWYEMLGNTIMKSIVTIKRDHFQILYWEILAWTNKPFHTVQVYAISKGKGFTAKLIFCTESRGKIGHN